MKKTIEYKVKDKTVVKEINYIPIRYIFAAMLSLFEILAILAIVVGLCYYSLYFYIFAVITHFACILNVVASDDNPDYKVPWLLVLMGLPIIGFMLYFMFYSRKLKKKFTKRLDSIAKKYEHEFDDSKGRDRLEADNERAAAQAKMLCEISGTHIYTDTSTEYFPLGETMHERMLEDIKKAEKFILLEYFIIEKGIFWNSVLDILKEKAASGVTVRVMYDDIGCMKTLPGNYNKKLKKYGIETAIFSRLRGNADSEFNNRNHRKILVIDGVVGYTGGINIADEYINRQERFGHWKDTAIRLEGAAVRELTRLFLNDFGINTKDYPELPEGAYSESSNNIENGYIVPFGDGPAPIYKHNVGKTVIQNMLHSATKYMYMTSPYLIIDNDLCSDIENTALRGVDVRIVVPHIPDKKIIFSITKSFYSRLMAAGVKIYEYKPGFIHAKNYISDDKYAMIGTINLDYRSLVHHFENGVWMYGTSAVSEMKADIEKTIEESIEVTPDMLKTGGFTKIMRAIVKIFSPML